MLTFFSSTTSGVINKNMKTVFPLYLQEFWQTYCNGNHQISTTGRILAIIKRKIIKIIEMAVKNVG